MDNSYVQYEEDGLKKFKLEMELWIMDALMGPEWNEDRQMKGYTCFVEN